MIKQVTLKALSRSLALIFAVALSNNFLFAPAIRAQISQEKISENKQAVQNKRPQDASAADATKQQAAEATADRFMQRLYETLDIGIVLKEFSASNTALRKLDMEILARNLPLTPEAKISDEAKERACIAKINFSFLMAVLSIIGREAIPDTTLKELSPLFESIRQMKTPISSSADLENRFTRVLEQMNALLRKHIKPEAYNSPAYRESMGKIKKDQPAEVEQLKELFAPVGLGKDAKIFVVGRELYYLYFIEEAGGFKFLTMSSRRRF
jgi:hypothetical protein